MQHPFPETPTHNRVALCVLTGNISRSRIHRVHMFMLPHVKNDM